MMVMTQEPVTTLTDDLDGGVATTTVKFGYNNDHYEIDLNDENLKSFYEDLNPYVACARLVRERKAKTIKMNIVAATEPQTPIPTTVVDTNDTWEYPASDEEFDSDNWDAKYPDDLLVANNDID